MTRLSTGANVDFGALLLRRLIDSTDFGAYVLLSADLAVLAYVGLAQIGDIGVSVGLF